MKIEELSVRTVRRAVSIYLDLAYGSRGNPRRMPDLDLPEETSAETVLNLFQREVCETIPGHTCERYSMRLGNRNYPFMKLLLQEHLVAGEYFFAVDTHDEMDIKPDFPDYEAWMAVRRFNFELKRKIEAQLGAEGLDTAATIREIIGRRSGRDGEERRGVILVVDDEEDLADSVEALLLARGYEVYKVFDGRSAVTAAKELDPDLVLLDYELPEMDGIEVMNELRQAPETAVVPVLLTSAGRIGFDEIQRAEGFLAKPFQEDLLYTMVERLLGAPRRSGT